MGNSRYFLEKVGEFRFNKVKSRQVNKFNNLVHKKEGNITWETSQSNRVIASSSQTDRQAGRQSPPFPGTALLPRESTQPPNSTLSREGLSQEGSNSQASNSLVSAQAGRLASNPLPSDSTASQEASTASPNNTPSGEGLSQKGNNSQTGDNLVSTQPGRQAGM